MPDPYEWKPPTCSTCKHFRTYVDKEGKANPDLTLCTIAEPNMWVYPQSSLSVNKITGEQEMQQSWAVYCGWKPVFAGQGCGKHEPRPTGPVN